MRSSAADSIRKAEWPHRDTGAFGAGRSTPPNAHSVGEAGVEKGRTFAPFFVRKVS
jgi:hypothetical protein